MQIGDREFDAPGARETHATSWMLAHVLRALPSSARGRPPSPQEEGEKLDPAIHLHGMRLGCDSSKAAIDYLSIDTEGTEFEILNALDFAKYRFNVITCEHNYTPLRGDIHELLSRNGYRRVFPHLSQCDDWYIASTETG